MSSVATQLQEFVDSLPRPAAQEMTRYLLSVPVKPPRRLPPVSQLHSQPYWIAFPVALANHTVRQPRPAAHRRTFLHDILCAQYYIYLAVRIRDDLFDGQAEGRRLSGVADLLELAADEKLSAHFEGSSAFWKLSRAYRRETAKGIREVDELQQRAGRSSGKMLQGFAHTSSIFKIGSAAVCVATGRVRLMRTIETIFDHLAIGGQIIDDVKDIVEDLKRGRYNYAVQMLLKDYGRACSPLEVSRHVLTALLNPQNAEEVVSVAEHHFRHAYQLLKRLGLRELNDVPLLQQRAAEDLMKDVQLRRVVLLFKRNRILRK